MHTKKRSRNRGNDWHVIGFDSETMQGPPITFQFYSGTAKHINGCYFVGKKSPTDVFLTALAKLKPGRYRMYGHNLEFDMLSALWDARASIRDGTIDLQIGDWRISGRYSKPVFATIINESKDIYIELVDSILWFMTSLDQASKLVCPDLPKLVRPKGLGITLYTAKDHDFVDYAMRDAEVAYFLGLAIERFHDELEIPSQISLASMAAAVFRIHFMQANIYQPPLHQWMVGAAASYHGGVNRVKKDAAPSWHLNVSALDLSSAYPDAMNGFPAFSDPNGYRKYKGNRKTVPALGIYRISGTTGECDWPALFHHDFKPIQGRFKDTWVTGFELNEALSTGEVSIKELTGFHYESRGQDSNYSPFSAYVQKFYKLKSDAGDPVMRYMYKILLNALTGKFIQTSPDYTLADGKLVRIMRAGGLYHPFIASLITGHTRAAIHALEHRYNALHTATDGIFVPGNVDTGEKKRLGATVCEGHGDLALFRNKLYIFYTNDKSEGAYESQVFDGRYILKCARHGFQGRIVDLEKMLVGPDRSYKINKPIKLKTALRDGSTPNEFVTTERRLRGIGEFGVMKYD